MKLKNSQLVQMLDQEMLDTVKPIDALLNEDGADEIYQDLVLRDVHGLSNPREKFMLVQLCMIQSYINGLRTTVSE